MCRSGLSTLNKSHLKLSTNGVVWVPAQVASSSLYYALRATFGGNWRNSEVVHRPNNGGNDYKDSHQNNRQGNQWFESRNRFQNDDRRFNDRGYQFRNRGQNDDFSRGDQRNRGSSENFSRGNRKQMGRLNVLKVNDIKGDQTQSINQSPIKLSAICMSPVEHPYVPILLDETFTTALWDT
ncbi:uncharacterized protein TNCV_980821 [Trichonephila clavipes]|uniref:Uncharacterized protein n=1 Tax=Trichonephila clavipes TaxID=2585209 RepID=A0A8X6RWD5_TRICX|nr:uncharacterized protein TNCV_980821 [Trichonephila clavipes]